MIKRRYLGSAAIIIVFLMIASWVTFSQQAAALDSNSPENGFYTLRYHDSGNILKITLAIYTLDDKIPHDATFDVNRVNGDYGCFPSRQDNDIEVNILGENKKYYGQPLTNSSCKKDATYTIPDGEWQPKDGRYYANVTLTLTKGSHKEDWYKDIDKKPANERRAWFSFKVHAGSNLLVTNRANTYSATNKTNYGVTGGDDYKMEFAQPCSEGPTAVIAGMWDPDKYDSKIRIQERPRFGGGGWTPIAAASSGMDAGPDGNGWFHVKPREDEGIAFLGFTMSPDKVYQLHLNTQSSNVVSLFWPYDTIQSALNCNYSLTPTVGPLGTSVDANATLSVSAPVANNRDFNTEPTAWRVTVIKYPSSTSLNALKAYPMGGKDADPCGAVAPGYNPGGCNQDWYYESGHTFSGGTTPFSKDYGVPDEPGTRLCFVNSVARPVNAAQAASFPLWRHSAMQCSIIAKRPKVQVLGSDLRVQGSINTSVSNNIAGKTYGSWIEYGVLSVGTNTTASSGSGLIGGNASSARKDWSKLTFANKTSPYGGYTPIPSSNMAAYFAGLPPGTPLLGSSVPSGTGIYETGSVNLSGGSITTDNTSVIIRSSGTVTINGNITVKDDNYSDIRKLSQVIIIAKDIKIAGGVSRVDAWLLATNTAGQGTINTCAEKTPGPAMTLRTGECSQSLEVNGPVVTDHLYLLRTAGADLATPGVAAEKFNLRPSAYLWAYNYVNKQDRAQTVYVTELPPRL